MPSIRPRLQLGLIALISLASLSALVATRPAVTGATWAHGDALAGAVAWLVATAASVWLSAVTTTCALALGFERPRLAQRFARALPGGIRRLVEVAVVASCVALPALPALPASAARTTAVSRGVAVVAPDEPVVRSPLTATSDAPVPRSTPAPTPAPTPVPERVVVRAGDNLWLIARTALAHSSGEPPDEAAVARYWRVVIGANRATLRSGDPSLIFAGEIVTLPPPGAVS